MIYITQDIWLMRNEVAGEWRRLHNKELYVLYSAPNITRGDQIKKNKRGRACSTYEGELHTGFWWGNLREDHLEDTGVDGRIILKWMFEK
jgi:hypothetical protein